MSNDKPKSEDRSPECKNSSEAPCYAGITIEKAMDCLRDAMEQDHDYAHSWHCNIAVETKA
jgi:hypothetical protein